jgi:hypothetical protein
MTTRDALIARLESLRVIVSEAADWAPTVRNQATILVNDTINALRAALSQAAPPSAQAWGVALCWSSSNPSEQVRCLADGAKEMREFEAHHSFIRWVHVVPIDPLDWPLPCDVKIGHGTHRKGTRLGSLVTRAQMLFETAYGPPPSAEDAARNLAELQGRTEPLATINDELSLRFWAGRLIARAHRIGLVVTIDRKPLRPLAMGHHVPVVEVWPVRNAEPDVLELTIEGLWP